jgi:hypothetical protein
MAEINTSVDNNNLNESLIKYKEIGCQTECINYNEVNATIKNNLLTIFYYNNDELNLCDFLPKLTTEKDGEIITNIESISIICSNFKIITQCYKGVKNIQLYKCPNFETMPNYLKKDLLFFLIDGKNQLENKYFNSLKVS